MQLLDLTWFFACLFKKKNVLDVTSVEFTVNSYYLLYIAA